jgi:hypothetical protein
MIRIFLGFLTIILINAFLYIEFVYKLSLSVCSPFGKGGWRGILRIYALFIIHKISPCPSFPKRGIMIVDFFELISNE